MVRERYRLPVYIANDGHMLALAEYMFGEGQDAPNLVAIKVGQGIGAGIVLHGQPLASDTFSAGEIGHVVVDQRGARCRCGNSGCLEALANIPAIIRRAQESARGDPHSLLHGFAPSPEAITLDSVRQAFLAGDPAVRQIIVDTGCYLGVAVAHLLAILGIRRIVITGRIAAFGTVLRDSIQAEVARRVLPDLAETAEIEVLPQGGDAILLGAAALLLTNELGLARLVRRQSPDKSASGQSLGQPGT
jgi:predicted NBD/HSP70 family sugar kinase